MKQILPTLVVAMLTAASSFAAPPRPNIILVMPDDQGYGDIAAHGNPLIRTPFMDQLHRESTRFASFHVSPTCAPTRSTLMSGKHEFKVGVTHTILERERLSLRAPTVAQVLKTAGYTTGIFGKWHLGDEEEYQPHKRGFDEVYIHGAGGIGQTYAGSCGDFPDNKYFDPVLRHNTRLVRTKGYCTDLFFDQAIRWMDATRKTGKPFFTYITPNAPHGPLISPGGKYDQMYEGKTINGHKMGAGDVAYYAMISNIDDNLGKILARLKEWKLDENTLFIFLSDNGGTHTKLFDGGMRGGKGSVYQGGTRAPSFWRWPGTLAAGVDVQPLAGGIDLLPTLADLTGARIPNGWQPDGRSLLPLLKNPQASWPDRYLFAHQGRWPAGQAEQGKFRNCRVRNQRFTLVNNQELYDLEADPKETRNVIAEHPEIVAKMRAAYDQWWSEALAGMDNEMARGPKINPFKALYYQEFGGGPDAALLSRMDPEGKFKSAATTPKKQNKKKKKQ